MRRLASAVGVVLAVAITVAGVTPASRAVVAGGIVHCAGLASSGAPYDPGTVRVYRGDISVLATESSPAGAVELPTTLVTQQDVAEGSTYRFVLDPGHYVLVGDRVVGPQSFVGVTLQPGDDLRVDVPNTCI